MSGTTSGVQFENHGTNTNMTLFPGKSLSFEVIWGGPTPIDISGYTASLVARGATGKLLLELSSANGRVANGGSNGRLVFSASSTQTRPVTEPCAYELAITSPAGQIYRVISGVLSIDQEVAP